MSTYYSVQQEHHSQGAMQVTLKNKVAMGPGSLLWEKKLIKSTLQSRCKNQAWSTWHIQGDACASYVPNKWGLLEGEMGSVLPATTASAAATLMGVNMWLILKSSITWPPYLSQVLRPQLFLKAARPWQDPLRHFMQLISFLIQQHQWL